MHRILSTTLTALLAVASGMSVAATTSKAAPQAHVSATAAPTPIVVSTDPAKIAAIEKHAAELQARDARALNSAAAPAAKKTDDKPVAAKAAASSKSTHANAAAKDGKSSAHASSGKSVKSTGTAKPSSATK